MNETVCRYRGFSLLEILVALVVVTLFCSAMLPAMIISLERMETNAHRATALLIARSQLEKHAVIAHDIEGHFEGREGAFTWVAVIDQQKSQPEHFTWTTPFTLRRVHIEVFHEPAPPLASLTVYRVGRVQ